MRRRYLMLGGAIAGLIGCLLLEAANHRQDLPEAEFHMARMIYRTRGGAGSHGFIQPWWAIDYPYAEEHFFAALRRVTNLTVSDVEDHLELTDSRIFEH